MISIVSFLIVVLLWLVALCLFWILSLLLAQMNGSPPGPLRVALDALTFKSVLQTVFFIVPNCTVMFLRYWAYEDQDKVFVAALRQASSSALGVTFRTRQKLGLRVHHETGVVTNVVPDSQADRAGVKTGWAIVKIDRLAYSQDELMARTTGNRDFVVTFECQGELAGTVADREHLAQVARALHILPAESTWAWLKKYIRRLIRGCRDAICLLAVSALPRVGPLIYPIALFLRRGRSVGIVPAVTLMAISLVPDCPGLPSGRLLASWGMQLILTARSTSKELLYTFYSRANPKQKRALHSQPHARITGFGVAATAVLSVPIIGPLLWFHFVRLAAELFSSVAINETRSVFDFGPAVELFRLEEARKREEQERRACERWARSEGCRLRARTM